jgi:hypothetical protein
MVRVPDMRRRTPEPPPAGLPDVQFKPGMADELLRELAPLLAEEGIDISNMIAPAKGGLTRPPCRASSRRAKITVKGAPYGRVYDGAKTTPPLTPIFHGKTIGTYRLDGAVRGLAVPTSEEEPAERDRVIRTPCLSRPA